MSTDFKSELFTLFARVGKALSNSNRLELLEFIAQGETNVEQLASKSKLSVANASQHLQQLKLVGLVRSRKEGHQVLYSVSGNDVIELIQVTRKVAENHIAEVKQLVNDYLGEKDNLDPINANELLSRINDNSVTIIDVRPLDEYEKGHLPGAINVPLSELELYVDKLPKNKEIIAYCRGPYCVLSFEAVNKLRHLGYVVTRYSDGYPEWKLAGLPIDSSQCALA